MPFSFAALAKSWVFRATVLIFVAANLWSWLRHIVDPICCDFESNREMTVGFPFPFHISGGIAGLADFYLLGLLLDIVIALTIAVLLTRLAAFFTGSDE